MLCIFFCSTANARIENGQIIIDSVEIHAENVYDTAKPKYDNFLFRLANSLHIVTKGSVISRELLLREGDVYDSSLAHETERNLRKLPYLLKTDVSMTKGANGEDILVVRTSDKWTTTGGVSLHRSGGISDIQIGIEENNLLGYGIFTSHDYYILETDRNFYQGQLSDNRFLNKPIATTIFYSDDPRNGVIFTSLERPLYSLGQQWGGTISYTHSKVRTDYYISEFLVAQDHRERNNAIFEITNRVGPDTKKFHFGLRYEYNDIRKRPRQYYLNPEYVDETFDTPPEDSLYHYIQLSYRFQEIKYQAFDRINRFEKLEDYNLGLDAQLYIGNAFNPGFSSTKYHLLGIWPQYSVKSYGGLIIAGTHYSLWLDGRHWIRKQLTTYLNCYFKFAPQNTLAVSVRFGLDFLRQSARRFYLDEDRGLRGYPAHLYGGEERLVINIEDRIFSDIEILSVGVGGVVFADIGSIWSRKSEATIDDIHTSIGAGLRFGVSRSTQAEIIRFDLAYAVDIKSWQLSFGTGQFF
ncbi:MAG: hypothetical protein R3F48_09885 [Candidatus Zixiibacteriota bacterium]